MAASHTTYTASPEDRRALRSKQALRTAFAQLAAQRGLDGFGVGDLTSAAQLNRSTFYAHYRDMDQLMSCIEAEIIDQLAALQTRIAAVTLADIVAFVQYGTPPAICVQLFEVLRQHGLLLRVLLSPRGDANFQTRLRDSLCSDLIRSVLHKKYTQHPTELTEYYIAYYAAAVLGLIQLWLQRNMQEDAQQMARIMLSIMYLRPGDPIVLVGEQQAPPPTTAGSQGVVQ